jgi:hypothetical protein
MSRPHRRGAAVAIAVFSLIVMAALSACAGLPGSTSVQQGSLVGQPVLQPVRVQPVGPAPGATPEQIVRGFLRAGAGGGFDDDHVVARSFFARSVREQWQPDVGVKVYASDSALKVDLLTPSTVRVSAAIVAEVDGDGRYREMPAGTSAQAVFGVAKLAGGWRITQPPQGFGLWLSASDLDRTYRSFVVAYVSEVSQTMVVDRRWFPFITSGLATTLARAQLAPVPQYLVGAARTGVPSETTLAVDSVPVQSGTAVVDLSAAALLADPDSRRAMWAQFVTTLSQLAAVSEVSLQVNGTGLDLPNTPSQVSSVASLNYLPPDFVPVETAILRTGSVLSRVSSDRPQDQDQPKPPKSPASTVLPTIPAGWIDLALSWSGLEIAGIGGDHADLARWQGDRHFQLAKFGSALTRPSYDSLNGLWVAGEAGGAARVWVIDTSVSPMETAKPRAIPVPWLANRRVLALKVATDNQRVALITSDRGGGDVQVVVAGITRTASGEPVALAAEPLRVGWTLTAATDLAWVDDSTLAVVGRVATTDVLGPQLVEIGGKITPMPPIAGARLVTNTSGLRGVVVLTDQGTIQARVGNGWQVLQNGTDFLIPGG